MKTCCDTTRKEHSQALKAAERMIISTLPSQGGYGDKWPSQ
jgi:hypothetical protein